MINIDYLCTTYVFVAKSVMDYVKSSKKRNASCVVNKHKQAQR